MVQSGTIWERHMQVCFLSFNDSLISNLGGYLISVPTGPQKYLGSLAVIPVVLVRGLPESAFQLVKAMVQSGTIWRSHMVLCFLECDFGGLLDSPPQDSVRMEI